STEAPLEGAVVWLERGSAELEAETDAEGQVSVVDLAPGGYTLRAFAPGYDERADTDVQVPAEAGELALSRGPGVRVTGVVVGDGSDGPVGGARVGVEGGGRLPSLPLPEPALTDAEGRFAFEPPLSRRGLRLVVTAPGFAAERHSVNA